MCDDNDQTKPGPAEFDFSAFPDNTLFHERRDGRERRKGATPELTADGAPAPAVTATDQRRAKKERRRRIDPTTFEKQYTPDELEFMNAMQRFKEATGKSFPTHGEVLKVAVGLGYRLPISAPDASWDDAIAEDECLAEQSTIDGLSDSLDESIATPGATF